jgi:imidazolonepropionase-like amidohydrolase
MKRFAQTALFAAALGLVTLVSAQNLVITNAHIIDGNGGVIERGSVVVRDGRIVSVAEGIAKTAGSQLIDARGMTVMPGFIDSHRHVIDGDPAMWMKDLATPRMQEFLDAGFTTIYSLGDEQKSILELRRRLKAGEVKGPRLYAVAFLPLAGGPPGFREGVDPARVDVSRPPDRPTKAAPAIPREQMLGIIQGAAKAGVDAFKVAMTVTPGGPEKDTLKLIVSEGQKLGIPTFTHAVSVEDTLAAVEAHPAALAHTPHIGQLTPEETKNIVSAGIPMMSTLGVFGPTFAEDNLRIRQKTGIDNVPRFRDLLPFPMNTLSSAGQGPVNARLLWDAGITYGYGTDTTFLPKDSLYHELKSLRLVFSRQDIVKIMTINAAKVIGHEKDLGTLQAGKLGDLVIVDGDPLKNIEAVLNVKVVVKEGKLLVDHRSR